MIARCLPAVVLALLSAPLSERVVAQSADRPDRRGWNDARVLALLDRARDARLSATVDSAFRSYRAEARGRVYFFVDRPDAEEHVLVKADQVALQLFWMAPDRTKQRIVGQRDEKVLPTSIRYHLDHLTVVQDDFGDYIRLGDGDEVEAVLHPVGPGSGELYDFQLVDSLSLTYGLDAEEVRVYEIRVRPVDLDRPGFVGTVFLDRATAAIVRMNFSFTPASYVDGYLDYIRISLDNSLWMGRHWLPYRQEVELRREMPLLDFSAGSVIRSRFDIRRYDFNLPLDESLFARRGVSSVSPAQRAAFPFEQGLFDEIDEEGLTVSTKMEEVRTQVREVVEDEVLSGLAPVRLHLDGLSDFARYNRAEGIFLGGGVTLRPWADASVRASAGYSFGRKRVSTAFVASRGARPGVRVEGYWNDIADLGGNPGSTPLENSISSASGSKDYLDPYVRTGSTVTLGSSLDRTSLAVSWEEQRSAADVVSDGPESGFRPVRSIDGGRLLAISLTRWLPLTGGGEGRVTLTGGRLSPRRPDATVHRDLVSLTTQLDWGIRDRRDGWFGRFSAQGGVTNPGAPAQAMFLLGGRHTLPGHEYRSFVGNGYWLARAEATVPLRPPWVGIRSFAVAGASYLGPVTLPTDWSATDSRGVRGSLGVGLSIGWDTIFLDVARGIRDGTWEAIFSVSEQFRGWM